MISASPPKRCRQSIYSAAHFFSLSADNYRAKRGGEKEGAESEAGEERRRSNDTKWLWGSTTERQGGPLEGETRI